MRPDYRGGGIVNLMTSLGEAFCVPQLQYLPLQSVDLGSRLRDRSVILLVIDGLGYHQLLGRDVAPCLNQHLLCALTSVFPSTTASAITTYLTGLAPQQHGLVGWHTYFEELDTVFTPLPFVPRTPGVTISSEVTPASLFAHIPLFTRIETTTHSVSPQSIAHSVFNRFHCGPARIHPYTTLDELFNTLVNICQHEPQRSLTYAYYPNLDFLSHLHGSKSDEVSQDLARLDQAFERFLAAVANTDTTILITADHGFVDPQANQRIDLADHPEVAQLLARPLCGEPRAAYCYVNPGKLERFETLVNDQLGYATSIYPSEQLVHEEFFGFGLANPQLKSRIGDFTLVMKTEYMLKDWLPGEKRFDLRGVHGGVSDHEMLVPLCIAEA